MLYPANGNIQQRLLGLHKEIRDQIRKALDDHGYINAYVTVDNFDWYMDDLFQKAVKAKKKIDFGKLLIRRIKMIAGILSLTEFLLVKL